MSKVINFIGTFDKRHITLSFADYMQVHGKVLVISNNPLYQFLNEDNDTSFEVNGIKVIYTVTHQENVSGNYDIIIHDYFKKVVPADLVVAIETEYDNDMNSLDTIKNVKSDFLKILYKGNKEKGLFIQREGDDISSYMGTHKTVEWIKLVAAINSKLYGTDLKKTFAAIQREVSE